MKYRTALAAAGLLSLSLAGSAAAAPIVLDFSSDQYTPNFRETYNTATISYNADGGNVLYNTGGMTGTTGITVYDTDPATAARDAVFLDDSISVEIAPNSFAGTNGPSAGIYTRVINDDPAVTTDGTGILGLLNVTNTAGTAVRLRLFQGASTTSTGVGTAFFDSTFDLAAGSATAGGAGSTNTVATNSPLTLLLTQTAGDDPVFNLTVSDADGLVASTGNVALTTTDAYNAPGAVGLRLNQPNVNNTIAVDNFAITPAAVPEPATLSLLALAAVTTLRRRRAR